MRGFASFISGVMLGAVVGATLAMLLAPSSGEELRTQVQSRAEQMQIEIKQAAASRRAELERQLATLRAPATTE